MPLQALVSELEQIVCARIGNWPPEWDGYHWPGYTWEHTLRVRALALRLARESGADERVVALAALLHDVEKPTGREHAHVGARAAEQLLRERGVNAELTRRICHAIDTHAGNNRPHLPTENLVLGDADLIDANFGLVGTWRFITIRAGHGSSPAETVAAMAQWLPKKDELLGLLQTASGRCLAQERSRAMHEFCARLMDAFAAGRESEGLSQMVYFIHREHRRACLSEQLPALAELGERLGDPRVVQASLRLRAEAAGEM